MTRSLSILLRLAATLMACLPLHARAGDVIAHPSVTLAAEDVRDAFLGEKLFAGGVRLVPVDNSASQTLFLSAVLQTDSAKYYARWSKKSFREGLLAPPLKGSDAEVINFVRNTPGAIGYVKKAPPGVNVLQSF